MSTVFDILKERGFIEKTTDDDTIDSLFKRPVTCYIGFDPTAPSFHVGSLIPIMSLAYMERYGHRPIALIGGGTGLVGDPSGKTEMRKILSIEEVEKNAAHLKKQLARFLDFKNKKSLILNNADWLIELRYIPFLRDIGRYFSVNRMLAMESYRTRMETGLSFIEFNYMILQAYDFLHLFETHNCILQMGGSDQWGNIVAGVELIRRAAHGKAYGITFPLITTSSGAKMGKTAKGAVWLDPELTTPYEYYQYWINTEDEDVVRFLSFFTFLPMEEIESIKGLSGSDLNMAKSILAFEATKLVHGQTEAERALSASMEVFGAMAVDPQILPSSTIPRERLKEGESSIPTTILPLYRLKEGIPAFKLFHEVLLTSSRGAARRLIEQGGAYVNGARIESFEHLITEEDLKDGEILLRAGKKKYHRIKIEGVN
ncbi:MAG: tyrosine--tRNA ligase [Deltaproteobacteria bacterium]|nr:tyrosine--tRNA ligase [Deltaproteobacteria bacterium]